jgi:hypothetical protein
MISEVVPLTGHFVPPASRQNAAHIALRCNVAQPSSLRFRWTRPNETSVLPGNRYARSSVSSWLATLYLTMISRTRARTDASVSES